MLFCGVSQWGVLVHIRQFETYFSKRTSSCLASPNPIFLSKETS
jgi:hypothetical protein